VSDAMRSGRDVPIVGLSGGASRIVDFPPREREKHPPHNLPLELSSFIGRQREMAEVKRLLSGRRLLTLTGPGGCGKTRLALAVGRDLVEGFEDGAWIIELASLSNPDLVTQAATFALGVREQTDRPLIETLTCAMGEKEILLVLDNCEPLVEACAALADTLLRACPSLRILATSREPLGVVGETSSLGCRFSQAVSPWRLRRRYVQGSVWKRSSISCLQARHERRAEIRAIAPMGLFLAVIMTVTLLAVAKPAHASTFIVDHIGDNYSQESLAGDDTLSVLVPKTCGVHLKL
jgi:hypothetical protein